MKINEQGRLKGKVTCRTNVICTFVRAPALHLFFFNKRKTLLSLYLTKTSAIKDILTKTISISNIFPYSYSLPLMN